MQHRIVGTTMPVLEVTLADQEMIFAESGELGWISASIQLRTSTTAGGQSGGLMSMLGRAMAGATIFMTEYTSVGGEGLVAFGARMPGQILELQLQPNRSYFLHRHGFICGTPGVQIGIGFQQRLGAGIFGGTGFTMQRLSGQGLAFAELHGEITQYDLQAGNTIRVHPGHVALFEDSVQFNIVTVPGIANALFGGSGLFLATLTGPGRVWLQSLTLQRFAHALAEFLPRAG